MSSNGCYLMLLTAQKVKLKRLKHVKEKQDNGMTKMVQKLTKSMRFSFCLCIHLSFLNASERKMCSMVEIWCQK